MKTKTWLGWAALGLALALGGQRLALPRASAHVLRFAHTFTTESERGIIDAAVGEFEQSHPGVRIQQLVSNSETYNTVGWRLQFQGRKQPDLYFHWQGYKVEACIERGWALNLEPYLHADTLAQFVPSTLRKQRGGTYFLPHSIDLSALVWYNKNHFARLRLAEPATFPQWIALCRAVRAAGILPLAQGNRDLWPMGNFAAGLMGEELGLAESARLFASGQDVSNGQAQAVSGLTRLREAGAFDLPGVFDAGAVGSLSDIDAKVMFLSGKSAQHILGSWFAADIQDARARKELAFEVGVFAVPGEQGPSRAMAGVTTGFLVNPASRNPQAAVDFLELLLSRKYQAQFAKLGNLSARRDAESFTEDPLVRRLLAIASGSSVFVPPPDTGYPPDQANVFYELCGKLLTGKLELAALAAAWTREKMDLARKGL